MRSVLGVPLGLLWIRSGRSRERRCISSSTMTRSLSLESEPAFHVYAPTVPVKSNISNARQQGMEVLGGIASFIAIGQALAAVPTIISVVRSVSNSREELQDLIFELEILVARYNHTKETLNLFSPVTGSTQVIFAQEEPYYMKILRTKLESLLGELNMLSRDCQRLADEPHGHLKSFRAAWPWKRQKVLQLYNQARTIQIHMESATRILMDRTLHTHSKLLSQIHNAVVQQSQAISDDTKNDGANPPGQGLVIDIGSSSQAVNFDQTLLSTALLTENPHSTCTCPCHQPQAKTGQEINVGLVPGRLSIYHSNVTQWLFPCRECDYTLPRVSVRVDYQFPSWLWNRAMFFKASISALTGISTSLRLPVVWPINDPIWAALRSPRTEDLLKYISQKSYTATDLDQQGGSIIEYAMAYNQLSIVLVLVNRFTEILKETRAANHAVAQARTILFDRTNTLSDFEVYTLNRVVELVDDDDEIRPLLLHEAVRSNGDLSHAMKTDTSTLNTLDTSGFTPLHLACLHNNFDALEFLLRHRADVHRLDRQGETALHMAAYRGLTHFASALLDAGSNINQRGKNGETPLHKACRSRSLKDDSQIVEYLLGRGAEASAVNDYSDTALHILANQPGPSASVTRCADICIRFGAWSVIDAQNHFGNTPLLKSLWEVNSSMVQILLDKGARCDIVSHKGLNVLHAAGRIGSEEVINLLLSQSARIQGIEIRSRSIDGLTPIGELRRAIHRDRSNATEVGMVKDRNPTAGEIQAFEALLRNVRDGYIAAEVQELEEAIRDIRHDSTREAQRCLQDMIRFKQKAGIDEETTALQAVDDALYEEGLDGREKAVSTLRGIIEKANRRIRLSPYEEEPEIG